MVSSIKTVPFFMVAAMVATAAHAQIAGDPNTIPPSPTYAEAHVPSNGRQLPVIDTTLRVQQQGDVRFVTGGIGDDERAEIEAMKPDFNFFVQSASKNGAYVEDAHVVISNKAGEVVLDTLSGPLLYAALPEGRYALKAQLGDQVLSQKFAITAKKPAHVHLGWNVAATVTDDDAAMKAR